MRLHTGCAILLAVTLGLASASADELFDFSFDATSGTVNGTITGTLDLPFVSPGGSGSGAASSLVFTSIPGFPALAEGDTVTSWTNQVDNSFTVTSGAITSVEFFATTGRSDPSDVLCLNSTGASPTFGAFFCESGLNELHAGPSFFGYNFGGLAGITFTPAESTVPEPSSVFLLSTLFLGVLLALRRRAAGQH